MTHFAGTAEVERLADRIAQAVQGCPDVAAPARRGVATYLSGRAVAGVAVRDTGVEVSVVVRYGRRLPEIADAIRDAVAPLVPGLPIDVHIDDIEIPEKEHGPGDRAGEDAKSPSRAVEGERHG
ncbi:hypothetical protein [Sphaerisporangium fuscum]|uniref:hypothetical protein n=1 Tax=Sphaerisporangium fuscum TaxID=2835868 RepID=UPI001BDD5E7F|nr:hypothetical protein [Sphaerisporangium fuscum]